MAKFEKGILDTECDVKPIKKKKKSVWANNAMNPYINGFPYPELTDTIEPSTPTMPWDYQMTMVDNHKKEQERFGRDVHKREWDNNLVNPEIEDVEASMLGHWLVSDGGIAVDDGDNGGKNVNIYIATVEPIVGEDVSTIETTDGEITLKEGDIIKYTQADGNITFYIYDGSTMIALAGSSNTNGNVWLGYTAAIPNGTSITTYKNEELTGTPNTYDDIRLGYWVTHIENTATKSQATYSYQGDGKWVMISNDYVANTKDIENLLYED